MEKQYEDIYGRVHVVSEEIARGGQGAVFRTLESNIAIKIEINPVTGDQIQNEINNGKFDDIRLLPIPEKINVTLPRAALKDYAGYVMTLLENMESFSKAFDKESDEKYTNKWLESIAESNEECARGFGAYIASGGKRRRILAYLKCACIIAKLHSSGLVYCDFSPNNVFISIDTDYSNVWLIDADNLNYQDITIKGGYYTPGYAAPEVVKGKGCTFYSDTYSFSVSLFYQLTGTHPFKGQMVENGIDEDDFADGIEEKANNGEIPWIADQEDDSNATETMIPFQMILSKKMIENFGKTFGEEGRTKRFTRPSIFEWAEILAYENDNTIKCDYCGMDFHAENNGQCPWCDTKNNCVKIKGYFTNGDTPLDEIWSYSQEIREENVKHIPIRLAQGFDTNQVDLCIFDARLSGKYLILSNFNLDYEFYDITDKEEKKRISGQSEIRLNSKIISRNCRTNQMAWIEVDIV